MRHRPCPPGAHNLVGETGSKRSSNHNTLSDKRYEENRTFFFFLRRGILASQKEKAELSCSHEKEPPVREQE